MRQCLLVSALVLAPLAGAAEPVDYAMIGMWDVFYEPENGGCAAVAQYDGDTVFLVGLQSVTGALALDIVIMNPAWQSIVTGRDYEVEIAFGDGVPWTMAMSGDAEGEMRGLGAMFETGTPEADRFASEFVAAPGMTWRYRGTELGRFTLTDAREAFEAVIACTDRYLDAAEAGADAPAAAAPPAATGTGTAAGTAAALAGKLKPPPAE